MKYKTSFVSYSLGLDQNIETQWTSMKILTQPATFANFPQIISSF